MYILAIDSSAGYACAALTDGETLLCETRDLSLHAHSQTLLPMIASMLKSHRLTAGDVGLFAVSVGPGSYTGVRIGVSCVKGLAFGRGRVCVPVSSLEALAMNGSAFKKTICPVIDARGDRIYTALFDFAEGKLKRLSEDELLTVPELDGKLKKLGRTVILTGDGSEKTFGALTFPKKAAAPALYRQTSAYAVALAALNRQREDRDAAIDEKELKPVYLRATQAERERIEKMKAQK